ncbi:hypothetical protein KR51_00007710 [Rubidibacter lacunae KORDI 51-2]|uniref:Transcription factor zinc-finger domain-containing protein n=2 Tax=Rubidibacter TaxID=582491 RepID=U5DNL5_9CHRO|nr:hypothetical protein KR51_00007710 [Rubidibacter lacunae KORDI 51-2]
MALSCPKCGDRFEVVVFAEIEVDRCIGCGGLWFDCEEVEHLKLAAGSEAIDVGDPQCGRQLDRLASAVACPRCGDAMTRMLDMDAHAIWYERCCVCCGIWLDAGEFVKFKDNFLPQSAIARIRNWFRP